MPKYVVTQWVQEIYYLKAENEEEAKQMVIMDEANEIEADEDSIEVKEDNSLDESEENDLKERTR